jgi:GNAT superfamily N-acetyltransferase
MARDPRTADFAIRQLAQPTEPELAALAELLIDASEGGASVGFMLPLTIERATGFWRRVAADVEAGQRILFITEDATGVIGTVQLVLAQQENQPHRAEISKMLVHRRARRRGIGEKLMRAAEDAARSIGRTVLVLDTATPEADRLYSRCGWTLAGEIPDYALLPAGGLCATRYYFKRL